MTHSCRFLIACLGLMTANLAFARLVNMPDYREMSDHADLVVIATPTARAELPGRTELPNITSVDATGKGHSIPAVEIETTFRPMVIMRGKLEASAADFKLLHLKLADPKDESSKNGPELVDFDPAARPQYLMFLKRRPDGRYEAFNGQTDPAFSIEKLQQQARAPLLPPAK